MKGFVYLEEMETPVGCPDCVKIGESHRELLSDRTSENERGYCNCKCKRTVYAIAVPDSRKTEKELHEVFSQQRFSIGKYQPELFLLNPTVTMLDYMKPMKKLVEDGKAIRVFPSCRYDTISEVPPISEIVLPSSFN